MEPIGCIKGAGGIRRIQSEAIGVLDRFAGFRWNKSVTVEWVSVHPNEPKFQRADSGIDLDVTNYADRHAPLMVGDPAGTAMIIDGK